jgi:flagellar biosynthetic protein FliP
VLGMVRSAIGTQQSPPNAIIVSLALFTTIFIMSPVWQEAYRVGIKPYQENQITQEIAIQQAIQPFRTFMLKNVREKDLALFVEFSRIKEIKDVSEIPIFVIIPAFIISEINTAFQIGFLIFIPFVVVDLIVSNILLSLGMFMLSPVMISLPFKILLFVLTDGWNLIIRGLILSYQQ